jgi:hypothetical protein
MRGDRRGGGADVNVRIGGRGGDRDFVHGRRFHRGIGVGVAVGGCRMIVKRVFFRHHMVVKRIRRCF